MYSTAASKAFKCYGVVTVSGVLSAAARTSGDKIWVLSPREWSTYFIHESVMIIVFLLFQFRPLVSCTKRLLAHCSVMQYSHQVTRLDSIGISNVASQEDGKGASTVSHKKAGKAYMPSRSFLILRQCLSLSKKNTGF